MRNDAGAAVPGRGRVPRWRQAAGGVAAAAALIAGRGAQADPNEYILDLDIVKGEHELEAKLGSASRASAGIPAARAGALSWGMAPAEGWLTEAYVQYGSAVPDVEAGGLQSFSWENVARFTEPGEGPFDFGAMLEIERPRQGSGGWIATLGPMLQTDIDRVQLNVNLYLQRTYDSVQQPPNALIYQVQLRLRSEDAVEPGLQVFGNLGSWRGDQAPADNAQSLGPALFGSFRLGGGRKLQYNAAVLLGATSGAPHTTVRAQIEYEY